MKKLYSKKLGGEAFALDPAQLDIFAKSGYTVPTPEEVIADAAVHIEPPEGKRAYVVFDCKAGVFSVRSKTATLKTAEVGGFVGEVVSAAIMCGFLEKADPDRPKDPEPTNLSTLGAMLRDAFIKKAAEIVPQDKPETATDAEEVVE